MQKKDYTKSWKYKLIRFARHLLLEKASASVKYIIKNTISTKAGNQFA
jgi:hypothetical protein